MKYFIPIFPVYLISLFCITTLRSEESIPAAEADITTAIDKGLAFLAKTQDPAGFWSTPDYPGLTGLAVQSFLLTPGLDEAGQAVVGQGIEFIRSSAKDDGGIYRKGLSHYNTSIALTTLLHAGNPQDRDLIETARNYLIDGQSETGGFGYEPTGERSRPDLDNTVFALESLALYRKQAAENPGGAELDWDAAIDFVTRCQNLKSSNPADWVSEAPKDKGGFTYTPTGSSSGTHSYGTMTYSGLLSLIYAEVGKDDPRIRAAVDWLSSHYTLEENPGQGEQGLFYYYFVMAKALNAAGIDVLTTREGKAINWRKDLAAKLLSLQRPDGSWASENGRWMEKDPVLVTSYVVLTLNTILK